MRICAAIIARSSRLAPSCSASAANSFSPWRGSGAAMSEPRAGTIVRGACRLCDPCSCACPPRALLKKRFVASCASRAWNLDANTIFFLNLSTRTALSLACPPWVPRWAPDPPMVGIRSPIGPGLVVQYYSVMFIRGNGVTLRTQKVIQGGDNGHVGRPCEVSLAPPCPELFCELRGLCRHSYFGPRTCGRSENLKTKVIEVGGPNPGFQRNLSPSAVYARLRQ